jgi:hypothetical protein
MIDGIIGFALITAAFSVLLAMWAAAIGAAVISAKRTYRALKRLHVAELASRSIAGALAIVVGFVVLISLTLSLLTVGALLPP